MLEVGSWDYSFREDNGRIFQAVSDDYGVSPTITHDSQCWHVASCRYEQADPPTCWNPDERESTRLDVQHFAFRAAQMNKNYMAPVDEHLKSRSNGDESEKKVLDIGCGSGIWWVLDYIK
jgi:hypothetical protein